MGSDEMSIITVGNRAMDGSAVPSLFFFTFHKCASVFFSRYVLQRAEGLRHIDHAARRFVGAGALPNEFLLRGHLYGPLRLSARGEVLERLVKPALDVVRCENLTACLMVRDPRDMLVSQFFHNRDGQPLRPEFHAAAERERERADAIRLGIDAYVLENAQRFIAGYERAVQLVVDHPATSVLRYEDMVNDWNMFKDGLRAVFDLCADALRDIEKESRPNPVEQPGAHKRSGATGDHRYKLAQDTVAALTEQFSTFLEKFGYLSDSGGCSTEATG
jgi:hypothetical protein